MPSSNQRILLTGVNGQVGGDLLPLLSQMGHVVAPTRADLDLSDGRAIRSFVRNIKPQWIVNPAAYTAVDKAESEPDLAYAINAEAPRAFGEVAAELGIPVIHFSTDYVFNGEGTTPWVETDPTGPLGVYGASKLAGEQALVSSGAAHLVFRTSWIYSSRGKNFLLTILRLAQQREELSIVDDQHGAPTWSRDLARMVAHIMRGTSGTLPQSSLRAVHSVEGIYHAAAAGETTWFGFARQFLHQASAARPEVKFARLVPVSSGEYPTPARRPTNSRLNCDRLQKAFAYSLAPWQESTRTVVSEVLSTQPSYP